MTTKSIFFRNDDLGWMPQQFEALMVLFRKHNLKLCAAAIPLYCGDSYKKGAFAADQHILEIHSHGYSHLDHQSEGKKAEFGDQRDIQSVQDELRKSKSIPADLFPENYFPAFTPPWNRMEDRYISLLAESGFKVLSRDGDKFAQVPDLLELNIHVDVHTSKKGKLDTPELIWMATEEQWKQSPVCGVMLHHKHMDQNDYDVLDVFLGQVKSKNIPVLNYSDLCNQNEAFNA